MSKQYFEAKNFLNGENQNSVLAAFEICKVLQAEKWISYLAGGCVRDVVLNKTAKDFDIATSAPPEVVERLFPVTKPVGKQFGTILVVMNGVGIEVTTFRKEGGYVDGRHPEEISWTDAKEDAQRRDFTMNALFYDPVNREIVDYVGGLQDLHSGVLRFVGEPKKRIEEDALRVLRGVRFAIEFDLTVEHNTSLALQQNSQQIKKLSLERVFNEIQKVVLFGPAKNWKKLIEFNTLKSLASSVEISFVEPSSLKGVNPWLVFFDWLYRMSPQLLDQMSQTIIRARELKDLCEAYKGCQRSDFKNVRAGALFEKVFEGQCFQIFCLLNRAELSKAIEFYKASGGIKPKPMYTAKDFPDILPGKSLGQGLKELYHRQLEGREVSKADATLLMQGFRSSF